MDSSGEEKPKAPGRVAPGRAEGALLILLGLVIWGSTLDFPSFVADLDSLDASWQLALGHFLANGGQAGRDHVWTYGPLGYFYTSAYEPALYWQKYAWELAVKLLMAAVLVAVAWKLPHVVARVGLLLLFVLFFPDVPNAVLLHRTDSVYGYFILALTVLLLGSGRLGLARLLPAASALALLSLVKFNLMVQAWAALAALTFCLIAQRRRSAAGLLLGNYAACFLLFWMLAGQRPSHLPAYLHGSMQLASGYSEAMALTTRGREYEVPLALGLFGLLLAALFSYGPTRLRRAPALAGIGMLVAGLFLMWKQGFVRHDVHSVVFFNYVLLVPLLIPVLFADASPSSERKLLLVASVLVAAVGRYLSGGEETLPTRFARQRVVRFLRAGQMALSPRDHQERLVEKAQGALRGAQPALQAAVGNATIDLIPHDQTILLLNGLHYRPRPVFQSYSAYTPYLLTLNAKFFRTADAPQYVLFRPATIDGRLPMTEDGPALLEVLRRYRPALRVDGDYLLLKRSPTPASGGLYPRRLEQRVETIRFEEEASLGEAAGYRTLALRIEYTALGGLRKFLYKPPAVLIDVLLEDEGWRTYRLIPALAGAGFLLDPFLERRADVLDFYQGRGQRVRALRVTTSEEGRGSFRPEIQLTLETFPWPEPPERN